MDSTAKLGEEDSANEPLTPADPTVEGTTGLSFSLSVFWAVTLVEIRGWIGGPLYSSSTIARAGQL